MDVNLLWSFYNTYIYQSITLDTLKIEHYFSIVVHLLSHFWLFVTPWTAECQASLSFTISWSLLKLMSIESIMSSNISSSVVPFSSCLQSSPASGSFPMSQFFSSGGKYYWSFSISPSKEYSGLISLGLTGLTSLQPKLLSRVFSNTTVQKHQFFSAQPSYITTGKTIALTIWTFADKVMSLLFNMLLGWS